MTAAREFNDPPSWLVAAIDQRVELLKKGLTIAEAFGDFQVAMMALKEPPEGCTREQFARWEQSCDNCGKHVPDQLWSGSASKEIHGTQVIICFGSCTECKDLP